MKYASLRHHDMLSSRTASQLTIQKQRFSTAPELAAAQKRVTCTVRAAAVAFVLAVGPPLVAQSQAANLLFRSGFDPATALSAPSGCGSSPSQCWQQIAGTDNTTGYRWPPNIWGANSSIGEGGVFQLIADVPAETAVSIGNHLFNQIVNVQGHTGSWTNQALYSQITKGPNGQNPFGGASTQNVFQFFPASEEGDLYISYWIKFQPGMTKNMIGLDRAVPGVYPDGGTWRAFFSFKTGTSASAGGFPGNDGDYRVEAYVITGCPYEATIAPCPSSDPAPFWAVAGDNNAGGSHPPVNDWVETNTTVRVPDNGQWNKLEIFWHRSAHSDGRVWMAIDGAVIVDHFGPNKGAANLPINRIFVFALYSGGRFPIYQWVDDLQIWDGFPPGNGDDPPYAPH